MARTKALKPAASGTNLALLDQQLADEAASLKSQISQSSGNRLKLEATGDFITPDGMNLGNEIQIVVVDFVSRNTYYDSPYNPQNPSPPACYAIGKDLNAMAPEEDSPAVQHSDCRTCPLNQFGSGSNGKSKACKNSRLLALLVVDPDNPDAHNEPDAPLYLLEVPPTSIKAFDGAAAHIFRALGGPPIKAVLTLTAKNAGTYAVMSFVDPVPNSDYAQHVGRRAETSEMLFRKPDFAAYEAKQQQPAARGRGNQPARRNVGRR